jgi:phosphoserine phosphatase RsbU/P
MGLSWDSILRIQLHDRRHRLESALPHAGNMPQLVSLLQQVDSTLERLESGSYGLCDVCQKPVEEDRILSDPLVRTCLSCLNPEQRRALEQDLDLASRIQRSLLPHSRNFAGWEVCFHYEPAGPVSGDYCDVVNDENEASGLFFLLGDVSGKGVAAALLVSQLHAIVRSMIGMGASPSGLMERANHLFCESTLATHYATLVCGRAHPDGAVEIANAGHCPPLVAHRGAVEQIEATGLPVGVFCSGQYGTRRVTLAPGDTVFLYTDGLSESEDGASAQYGSDRLADLLGRMSSAPPQALITAFREDVAKFRGGLPGQDDLTMMVIRRVAE